MKFYQMFKNKLFDRISESRKTDRLDILDLCIKLKYSNVSEFYLKKKRKHAKLFCLPFLTLAV